MRRMRRGALAGLVVLACVLGGGAGNPARADDAPSAERLKSAAEEYDRGRRAFLADDFDGASVHFENAYRDAPRAETLRLAIRARRSARQYARAATLAGLAQQRYPNDPATAQLAKETLDDAAPRLHEYAVSCRTDCAITADGRVVTDADATAHRVFLDPGSHELGVSFKAGGSVTRRVDATAGGKGPLAFEAPKVAPPPPVVTAPPANGATSTQGPAPREGSGRPLPPAVFFVAAGITVGLGAATVVSGLDARANPGKDAVRAACAGKDTSCPEYQDGKDAELRTNVLLGVTIGAAALTAVTGLFLTRWSRSGVKVGAAALPGGGAAAASFAF